MLIRKVEKYLRDTGIKPTRFGRDIARDPMLVHDMRRGREPGPEIRARILNCIATRDA